MNINKLIIDTLKPTKLPVLFQTYSGVLTTYIVFTKYLELNEIFTDDEEEMVGHYIQINIYSKSDYTDITSQVKQLLKDAGFKKTSEIDLYEDTTKLFHKGIRYFYLEDLLK